MSTGRDQQSGYEIALHLKNAQHDKINAERARDLAIMEEKQMRCINQVLMDENNRLREELDYRSRSTRQQHAADEEYTRKVQKLERQRQEKEAADKAAEKGKGKRPW